MLASPHDGCSEFASRVVAKLSEHGLTVSTAESCTAGLIASTIASVPGASDVLRGGAVTYVDEIKHKVLGVSEESLYRFSAVSEQVACEMAEGSRRLFDVDIAVSATGYAGPGGGTEQDPVGTVYLGISTPLGAEAVRCCFEGDRQTVRDQAVMEALELIDAAVDSLE